MRRNQKRSGRVIDGDARYLVRLDADTFFTRVENGKFELPRGTRFPSAAWHGSYLEADALVQKFRSHGFLGAVVADLLGRLVDAAALANERAEQEARMQKFWND